MISRWRKTLLRALAVLVGGGLLLAMLGFGLFRSDPSWYHPVRLTEAQQVAGQQRLFDRLAALRNEVGRSEAGLSTKTAIPTTRPSFDIEMTEDELNGVMLRWGGFDPRTRAILAKLEEPHVRFLPGRIEFAARAKGTLMSIEITVIQDQDGPPRVQLGRPWAGRLPLLRSPVESAAAPLIQDLRASKNIPTAMVDVLEKFVAGEEVTPVLPLASSLAGEGMVPARVEKLTVEAGTLKATLRRVE